MSETKRTELTAAIREAQADADGSFERLYRLTYDSAQRKAYLLLTDKQDVEDALQSSYMYIAMYIKDLKKIESFDSWMHTIIIHECKKILQKRKRSFEALSEFIRMRSKNIFEEEIMLDYVEAEESAEIVRQSLSTLTEEKRDCIQMYYFENKSVREISGILSIPSGTVKSRLFTARKELIGTIEDMLDGEEKLKAAILVPILLSVSSVAEKFFGFIREKGVSAVSVLCTVAAVARNGIASAVLSAGIVSEVSQVLQRGIELAIEAVF
ncbi:MAG: RNA polymerase sigma factor [Clostridia bacterium]|nr:RNA polymerase sigma factor [Clostridia bacterium]